ncbi:hypothetical protein [Saccharopolyspora taberi]
MTTTTALFTRDRRGPLPAALPVPGALLPVPPHVSGAADVYQVCR